MNKQCTVDVRGPVTTLIGKARIAVPRGRYTLHELSLHEYELRRESGEVFELSLRDVAHYMQREMAVIQGRWP